MPSWNYFWAGYIFCEMIPHLLSRLRFYFPTFHHHDSPAHCWETILLVSGAGFQQRWIAGGRVALLFSHSEFVWFNQRAFPQEMDEHFSSTSSKNLVLQLGIKRIIRLIPSCRTRFLMMWHWSARPFRVEVPFGRLKRIQNDQPLCKFVGHF